jgi:hypothetical protein
MVFGRNSGAVGTGAWGRKSGLEFGAWLSGCMVKAYGGGSEKLKPAADLP